MGKKLTKSELSSAFLLTKNKEKTWAFYLIHNFGHPISTAFEVIANLLKEKNKRLSLPLKERFLLLHIIISFAYIVLFTNVPLLE